MRCFSPLACSWICLRSSQAVSSTPEAVFLDMGAYSLHACQQDYGQESLKVPAAVAAEGRAYAISSNSNSSSNSLIGSIVSSSTQLLQRGLSSAAAAALLRKRGSTNAAAPQSGTARTAAQKHSRATNTAAFAAAAAAGGSAPAAVPADTAGAVGVATELAAAVAAEVDAEPSKLQQQQHKQAAGVQVGIGTKGTDENDAANTPPLPLRVYQVLHPALVGRAHVFGNQLQLQDEVAVVDLPYFDAPGAWGWFLLQHMPYAESHICILGTVTGAVPATHT